MSKHRISRVAVVAAAAIIGTVAVPEPVSAHCDSMDGPVVSAARKALETGSVELVLIWVRASEEPEILDAFERTLRVRASGGEAAELADTWFFETLVRVHRLGEGEPYTGLRPAGAESPAGIVQADESLARGSVAELAGHVAEQAAASVRQAFERVSKLAAYDVTDVEAGRRYVRAYTEYVHFVEALHALTTGEHGVTHGSVAPHDGAGR